MGFNLTTRPISNSMSGQEEKRILHLPGTGEPRTKTEALTSGEVSVIGLCSSSCLWVLVLPQILFAQSLFYAFVKAMI